ncbi:hypothetical protein BD779DRAFT_1652008 [Infundibulicybe gibba]|nr:hypothetical protein BD779DRAFT_1652008 [Infundibulicybe gibba]
MPVMIRTNTATELCITRGQEAVVHGWQESVGSRGQRILDVLFVRLLNPPQRIQFEGLPQDVVPLLKTSVTTLCNLPDDSTLNITQSQVEVLPNFAMTDYASQGKTRVNNVVDLNNCHTHQSYYTALSRSASAEGTLILQGFDARKITGGASGALRQEFRDIELLDEISRLQYEGKLHKSVVGDRRNTLINAYRLVKGETYVPAIVHSAIRWSKSDPYMLNDVDDGVLNDLKTNVVENAPLVGDSPIETDVINTSRGARVLVPRLSTTRSPPKWCRPKKRDISSTATPATETPIGTQWRNNSCAYDTVISLFYNIWKGDATYWSSAFQGLNSEFLGPMAEGFASRDMGRYSLDDVRDFIRRRLNHSAPHMFQWGELTSVNAILNYVLATENPVLSSAMKCPRGHLIDRRVAALRNCLIDGVITHCGSSTETGFDIRSGSKCSTCDTLLIRSYSYVDHPPLLAWDITGCDGDLGRLRRHMAVMVEGQRLIYELRGVIYYGNNHFTMSYITRAGYVWHHDGLGTGRVLVNKGQLVDIASLWTSDGTTSAIVSIYVRT